VMSLRGECRG